MPAAHPTMLKSFSSRFLGTSSPSGDVDVIVFVEDVIGGDLSAIGRCETAASVGPTGPLLFTQDDAPPAPALSVRSDAERTMWATRPVAVSAREDTSADSLKALLTRKYGFPAHRQRLYISTDKEFAGQLQCKRLTFDPIAKAFVCRLVDAAAVKYCAHLHARALTLDRLIATRGVAPDGGCEAWWLDHHPPREDVLKDIQALFNGLASQQDTPTGPKPGGKRVDMLQFAEALFAFAATHEEPVFDVLLRHDKIVEYHAMGGAGTPKGTIAWADFAGFWHSLSAQYDAEVLAMDRDLLMDGSTGGSKYRAAAIGCRPLNQLEKAAMTARRRAKRVQRRGGTVGPCEPAGASHVSADDGRDMMHAGQWGPGTLPFTTHALWSQQQFSRWQAGDAQAATADATRVPMQRLEAIIAHFSTQVDREPANGYAHLALATALYASGKGGATGAAAARHFQTALAHNAHDGDVATLQRAAMCLQDAGLYEPALELLVSVCSARPNDPIAHMDLAMACWRTSNTWDALKHWQAAWLLEPSLVSSRGLLGLGLYTKTLSPPLGSVLTVPFQLLDPEHTSPSDMEAVHTSIASGQAAVTRLLCGEARAIDKQAQGCAAMQHLRATLAHGWTPADLRAQLLQWGLPLQPDLASRYSSASSLDDGPPCSTDLMYYAELDTVIEALAGV